MTGESGWLATYEPYSLLVARGLSAVELIARLGGQAGKAVPRTAAEAEPDAAACFPDQLVVRAGEHGSWAFAIEPYGGLGGPRTVCRVSAGTVAVAVSRDARALALFSYAEDGRLVTGFELATPWERFGADPDRFVSAMRRAGIDPERDVTRGSAGSSAALAGLVAGEVGAGLARETFAHAALLSAPVPNPLLASRGSAPGQPRAQASAAPVVDTGDPRSRARFREYLHANSGEPGTVVRFTLRSASPEPGSRGPVSGGRAGSGAADSRVHLQCRRAHRRPGGGGRQGRTQVAARTGS